MKGTLQQPSIRHRGARFAAFTPFQRANMRTRAAGSVVRELAQQVAGKQRSAVEVTQEYLRQLRSAEDALDSFITVDEEHALAQVRRALRAAQDGRGGRWGPHEMAVRVLRGGGPQ